MNSEKYLFKKPLIEGLIKSRPNRFIMMVEINGKVEKCHCPSTGRIGDIIFKDIPCLVSKAESESKRKTKFTVEAFSNDNPKLKNKTWIGINQTKANAYIEFFLKNNLLGKMIKSVKELKREVNFAHSRLDFLVNNKDYIEVKTPLIDLPNPKKEKQEHTRFNSFDRLVKHFNDLSKHLEKNKRAILLMCYIFDAPAFKVPPVSKAEMKIVRAARRAQSKGLENWQINLAISKEGVRLVDYFKLELFHK